MNSSTSALFQNNLVRTPQVVPSMVKTSNPVIFPSLHPMSSFYKQKQVATFNNNITSVANDIQGSYKKVKYNNGNHKVVKDFHNNNVTKTITKEIKQEKINQPAETPFRVPKLPSRLNSPNNNQQKTMNMFNMTQIPQDFGTISDQLVVSDNVKVEWEIPETVKPQPLVQNSKLARIPNSAVDIQVLNRIYENLRLEFFAFQLKQNMMKAQQQQQRQQENLRQSLKQLLLTNSSPDEKLSFNQRDRSSSIDTDTGSIKEEYIKQEVAL